MASNHHKLVSPGWVAELVAGGNPGNAGSPPTYPGNGHAILEVTSFQGGDNSDGYNSGHVPGAIHLNAYSWEGGYPRYPYARPADGKLLPDAKLQTAIEGFGISRDTTVVVYADKSATTTAAARIVWMLMYAGVADVRLLNGGKDAWRAYGGALETAPNKATPVAFGATVPLHPEYLATAQDIRAGIRDSTIMLGDIRRMQEFVGAPGSNTYPHFNAEGRIPGAVWLRNASEYLNTDGTLRSYAEIEQFWRDQGITPDKKLVFY